MKRRGCNVPVSFPNEYMSLYEWVMGQSRKKYLDLPSVSAVVRKCIEIVRDQNLLVKK